MKYFSPLTLSLLAMVSGCGTSSTWVRYFAHNGEVHSAIELDRTSIVVAGVPARTSICAVWFPTPTTHYRRYSMSVRQDGSVWIVDENGSFVRVGNFEPTGTLVIDSDWLGIHRRFDLIPAGDVASAGLVSLMDQADVVHPAGESCGWLREADQMRQEMEQNLLRQQP